MQTMLSAIGLLLSVNTHYGQMPDSPDNVILLNFSGGNTPRRSLGLARPTVREPMIQLFVRNTAYMNAVSEVNRCIDILEAITGDVGGKKITKLTQFGDVLHLGRDEKNRYEFTINFTVQIDNT